MLDAVSSSPWPAHTIERREWRQRVRGGSREDRMLRHVDVWIPPLIASLDAEIDPASLSRVEEAVVEISRTDAGGHPPSSALARFLLRGESVASSKIERISASTEDYARALGGSRANASASSMVAASAALHRLVDGAGRTGGITQDDLCDAHRALMADDPGEAAYAGRVRDMQNWIGGSDHSPRDALFVPPPPEIVGSLLDDLLSWVARDDMPALVQATIAHAQFESIHPFTDGNGRIGRALISAVLRRRGIARNVVMPLASGLLEERDAYFDALTAYRRGDPLPIIAVVTRSARVAAVEARRSMETLRSLPAEWAELLGGRRSTVTARLIETFTDDPVMTSAQLPGRVDAAPAAVYAALDRMVQAGVLTEITGRKRDRVWAAPDVLGELDELDRRVRAVLRADRR